VVERRSRELNLDVVFQGSVKKTEVLAKLLESDDIEPSQIAYIGDDVQDIPIMERIGIPIAVQNAVPAVKECSVYVTKASGGNGAVREAVEWLLDLRGDKEAAYKKVAG
jgi:3-deoxy-D-manno-octulosonate 8-phosphate phosphatase (KDO 8-P phosphatase)